MRGCWLGILAVWGIAACAPVRLADHTPIATTAPATQAVRAPDLNTFEGVVADILAHLEAKDVATLRATKRDDLIQFHMGWGMWIRNHYGLWSNQRLLKDCARHEGLREGIHPDSASSAIMEAVWERANRPDFVPAVPPPAPPRTLLDEALQESVATRPDLR